MPGALRALCPVGRGVITGIRPYARYQASQTERGSENQRFIRRAEP
jgi:hypothetical protein